MDDNQHVYRTAGHLQQTTKNACQPRLSLVGSHYYRYYRIYVRLDSQSWKPRMMDGFQPFFTPLVL